MDRSDMKAWVDKWKVVEQTMLRLKKKELPATSTEESIRCLDSVFEYARTSLPLRPSSGLLELRKLLAKKYRD